MLAGALSRLVHLGHGLAAIHAFIGAQLALHRGRLRWPAVPGIPTPASLAVLLGILAVAVATSLLASRREAARDHDKTSEMVT